MIQRIQTIWLLLIAACAFASLKLPFYSGNVEMLTENIAKAEYHQLTGTETIPLIILTTSVGVLSLITIFLYNNRKLQMRLCLTGLLIELAVLFLYYRELNKYTQGTFSLTSVLQILIVLLFLFAYRGIYKDNKIVKESDRLR
jgi:hypothetical protein